MVTATGTRTLLLAVLAAASFAADAPAGAIVLLVVALANEIGNRWGVWP